MMEIAQFMYLDVMRYLGRKLKQLRSSYKMKMLSIRCHVILLYKNMSSLQFNQHTAVAVRKKRAKWFSQRSPSQIGPSILLDSEFTS